MEIRLPTKLMDVTSSMTKNLLTGNAAGHSVCDMLFQFLIKLLVHNFKVIFKFSIFIM